MAPCSQTPLSMLSWFERPTRVSHITELITELIKSTHVCCLDFYLYHINKQRPESAEISFGRKCRGNATLKMAYIDRLLNIDWPHDPGLWTVYAVCGSECWWTLLLKEATNRELYYEIQISPNLRYRRQDKMYVSSLCPSLERENTAPHMQFREKC
jgi:hypothetical protein